MDYYELAKELDKIKYYVEFSFDMSLRDFIKWLFNLPISLYFFVFLFIACINIVIWYIKHPPQD